MPVQPIGSRQPLIPALAWFPWVTGRYYYCPNTVSVGANGALGNGNLRAIPFVIPNAVTLTRIGAEVTIVGDNGCTVRLGLYADDGTGRPGSLVIDAGTIAGDSATVQEITVSVSVQAGVYYAASVIQGVTVTQPTLRTSTAIGPMTVEAGTSTPGSASTWASFTKPAITTGLPNPYGAPFDSGTFPPRLFVKVG